MPPPTSSMRAVIAMAATVFAVVFGVRLVKGLIVLPQEVHVPGSFPFFDGIEGVIETPDLCAACHGGYDPAVEPTHNWSGSMMANATRDPVFWAALAVTEQDFEGAGDWCLRCHAPTAWLGGRSMPTNGSGILGQDAVGVSCGLCHRMVNPDNSEFFGVHGPVQAANTRGTGGNQFQANDKGNPPVGYYGGGMYVMHASTDKFGPYSNATAPHSSHQSTFHRMSELCGTCHDVSNPVVGDLAPNNGKQPTGDPVVATGGLGSSVLLKAPLNNFPYMYGVVERTFSEHKASSIGSTLVSSYPSLPADLRAGALKAAYESAVAAGNGGNYEDGSLRYFTCQTCHLPPVAGRGSNPALNTPLRKDLPKHDLTGGNYWVPEVIKYLDDRGLLRAGGGLSATHRRSLDDGATRARRTLSLAATLTASARHVRVVNTTGHKLISGYPEGRRMWLTMKWYDVTGRLLREDGKYGPLSVTINGWPRTVNTLLDLTGANTKIYESHSSMTQDWAVKLLGLGYPADLPLSFDRVTGDVSYTLGQLAAQAPGTHHETFHFVLNNHVAKDNRIPPYGMRYEEARKRNALPVPASQYGNPGPSGVYNYWDDVPLDPPPGAAYGAIGLLYQPTSWEYIQFLDRANNRKDAFLKNEGANLLDAWFNTGMAEPHVMSVTAWGDDADRDGLADVWERQFGLDPLTASADADPDGDGRTNREEYLDGTHPRGFTQRYLSEGATSPFFDTTLAVINTSDTTDAAVLVRYLLTDGTTITRNLTIPAASRRTLVAKDQPGLDGAAFSTVVESDELVVVERTMSWDARGYGGHTESAVVAPARTWYLAEGATHSGFQTFYLFQNPNAQAAQVTVDYLLPPPAGPVQKTYTVGANSRFNVWVNDEARRLPSLASSDVSARIVSDRPIIVERAMYLDAGGRTFGAGHGSAGITAPALTWFLAEGATGGYFDQFVLVANPNDAASQITVRFLLENGTVITRPYTVAPNSRFNISVDQVDPLLADAAVSTTVTVTNDVPVVVERAMWWPGPTAATWHEAHNSPGVTESGARWGLAEGEQGGARGTSTFILIANTSAAVATVRVRLLFENGATAERTFTIAPTSRFNVDVGALFPTAAGQRFGAIVEGLGGAPIVVERSMYWNAEGVIWAAGTNAIATRLP